MAELFLINEPLGVWRLRENGANAYAVVHRGRALFVDPLVRWERKHLRIIGASAVDGILLTRPDRERFRVCAGWNVPLHLSGASAPLLDGEYLAKRRNPPPASPVSSFYDPPAACPDGVVFDLFEGTDFVWNGRTFRFLPTPGQTPAALTILLAAPGVLLGFPGDALSEGGKFWHPHHLEWDHWTSEGIRAAVHGLDRLAQLPLTALLPARGGIIDHGARRSVRQTRTNLAAWAAAKDRFVPGIRVASLEGGDVGLGVRRFLPHLYHLGASGYVLAGEAGSGLIVDAVPSQEEAMRHAMQLAGISRLTATATHYHCDHVNGLNCWRKKFGARIALTEFIAGILLHPERWKQLPFRGEKLEKRPAIVPVYGRTQNLEGISARWHHLPGQTKFHDGIVVNVDGMKVVFSGDNFFSPLRYGGTGGCSAANLSTPEGFAESARFLMKVQPDIVAAGHNAAFWYSGPYFQAVLRWSARYRRALDRLHLEGDVTGYFAV